MGLENWSSQQTNIFQLHYIQSLLLAKSGQKVPHDGGSCSLAMPISMCGHGLCYSEESTPWKEESDLILKLDKHDPGMKERTPIHVSA